MNWEAIGAIGEALGGLAVIASLIYVGVQIKQNSKVAQGNTEKDVAINWSNVMSVIAENPQLAEVFLKGLRTLDELNEVERIQFGAYCNQILSHHSNSYRMHKNGLLGKDIQDSGDRTILGVLNSPAGRLWWEEYGSNFEESHQDYVKQLLERNPAPSWAQSKFFSGDA